MNLEDVRTNVTNMATDSSDIERAASEQDDDVPFIGTAPLGFRRLVVSGGCSNSDLIEYAEVRQGLVHPYK